MSEQGPQPMVAEETSVAPAPDPAGGVAPEVDPENRLALNPRALSLREWSDSVPAALLLYVLTNVFGIHAVFALDAPHVKRLRDFMPPSIDLPPRANNEALYTVLDQLTDRGFDMGSIYDVLDPLHRHQVVLLTLGHSTLPIVARIRLRRWLTKPSIEYGLSVEYLSAAKDGTFIWTMQRPLGQFRSARCQVFQTKPKGDGFDMHREAMMSRGASSFHATKSVEQIAEVCERLQTHFVETMAARKVLRPLVGWEREFVRTMPQWMSKDPTRIAVTSEIARVQMAQTGWGRLILPLIVTAAIFAVVGLQGVNSTSLLLMLMGVLFVHELGHFAAMRAFGFRNLRMFFVPGFGAAVTGQGYTVAGWKKVVVYLMGPLPGIVAGTVLSVVGLRTHVPWMSQLGLVTVAVNGFNLIPILPFDGGRVLHETLFVRHPVVAMVFRGLACLGLVAVGVLLKSMVLTYLIVVLLMSAPEAWRQANVSHTLRRERFSPGSAGDTRMPLSVAEVIITRVRAASPKAKLARNEATAVLGVYEALSTRPPGVMATIALLGTYLVAFAMSIFVVLVLMVARNGSPKASPHKVDMAAVQQHIPPAAPASEKATTMVMTWPNHATMARRRARVEALVPPACATLEVGDSLIVQLPAESSEAINRLAKAGRDERAEVITQGELERAEFSVSFVLPPSASPGAFAESINAYFVSGVDGLRSPWGEGPEPTPEQMRARLTYRALDEYSVYAEPEVKELSDRYYKALSGHNQEQAAALEEELTKKRANAEEAHEQSILNDASGKYDTDLARWFIHLAGRPQPENWYQARTRTLAPRLGLALPDDAGTVRGGEASVVKGRVRMTWIGFDDPLRGLPIMLRWLADHGASDIEYDVFSED